MNGERRFRLAILGACLVHAALLFMIMQHRCAVPARVPQYEEPLVGVELALTQQVDAPVVSHGRNASGSLSREQPTARVTGSRQRAAGALSCQVSSDENYTGAVQEMGRRNDLGRGSEPGEPDNRRIWRSLETHRFSGVYTRVGRLLRHFSF